jgi:putative intracellular protease/amidase
MIGYKNFDFQSHLESRKSTSKYVFTLCGGAIIWRSVKQSCIASSIMEVEYVTTCKQQRKMSSLRSS